MRIRKRQVPLPLSSLSPVPLSDLHMEAPVQLPPPPFDHQNQRLSLIRRRSGDLEKEEDEARSWNKGEVKKINDPKNPAPISSSNMQAAQRWCDGDKAFPPKKRRGNNNIVEKDEATTRNKSSRIDHNVGLEDDDDDDDDISRKKKKKNMRLGKGGLDSLSGSRCSRVNGRGWRCCQQTLVGYSLCEHHLGKGRLRTIAPKKAKKNIIIDPDSESKPAVSCFLSDQVDDDDEKRLKLGMVKARSMSSLLGQTHQNVIVTYALPRS